VPAGDVEQVVDLDLATATVRLDQDDNGLVVAIGDGLGGAEVYLNVRVSPEAWHAASRFAWKVLALEAEIKRLTTGRPESWQHGPLTGPWPG
jgi:hypothetical protein